MDIEAEIERLVATGMQRSEAITRAALGMVEAVPVVEPETPWTWACCDRFPRCNCAMGLV
jgi:hypothetical protein